MTDKIDITTSIVRGLFTSEELDLRDFSVVLNNAFFQGEIVPDCSQETLDKIFEGIECFRAAAKMDGL